MHAAAAGASDRKKQVTAAQAKSHDFLEEVWENAVKLAMNHVPDRIHDVVATVSQRLIDIKRFAQAAELFEGIDKHTDAINVYIAGGMWEQARELAKLAGPKMEREVNEAYKRQMADTGAADELVHSGNVAEGIEAYAQKGAGSAHGCVGGFLSSRTGDFECDDSARHMARTGMPISRGLLPSVSRAQPSDKMTMIAGIAAVMCGLFLCLFAVPRFLMIRARNGPDAGASAQLITISRAEAVERADAVELMVIRDLQCLLARLLPARRRAARVIPDMTLSPGAAESPPV